MNQKQLQYFVTVYQTKNIQTAADRLFVSRQGVSKVIRLLEEELGQKLFIRSVRGVIPTDYATILLPHPRAPHARGTGEKRGHYLFTRPCACLSWSVPD